MDRDTSRRQKRLTVASIYILLLLGAVIYFMPFLWLVATSLKPIEQTMTKDFDLLPRAYYATIDGARLEVVKAEAPLKEDGFIVVIDTGPKAGEQMLLSAAQYHQGLATLEVQEADRILKRQYPATLKKEVQAGWIRVTERIARSVEQISQLDFRERAALWTAVPPEEIASEVEFRWNNYAEATQVIPFKDYTINTLIVAILGMIGTTLSSAVVAYGFSRIEWKGRDFLFTVTLSTMMIPFPVTMIPLYSVFKQFGMIGTLQPLWLPAFFGSAYNIFLLRQFFMTLPRDISEAAIIDGCNEFEIFVKLILPLARPALIVVALFHFMYAWNDFMGPLIYLTKDTLYTLAVGLQAYQSKQGGTDWNYMMAATTLTILPVVVIYFLAQKTFIEGISMTGSKG